MMLLYDEVGEYLYDVVIDLKRTQNVLSINGKTDTSAYIKIRIKNSHYQIIILVQRRAWG